MPPPFCAVVHSDISLHKDAYLGVGCRAAILAFDASAGSLIVLASLASSRRARRSRASASSFERLTALFRTGSKGWPQSRCLTRMWRNRMLSASFFAFFAGGGWPDLSDRPRYL